VKINGCYGFLTAHLTCSFCCNFAWFLPRDALVSAKRGVTITRRLSVTLVDCDHIGWNSCKIISPLVSLGCSLSADPNIRGLLQGEHPEILAQSNPLLIWASETFERKLPLPKYPSGDWQLLSRSRWLQKGLAQRSQWTAYRKPPSLFRMVPSLTLYDLPPKWGFHNAPKTRKWPYLRNGSFDVIRYDRRV